MPANAAPPGRNESPGTILRAWGRAHPTLQSLTTLLRSYPEKRTANLEPGLYVDHVRTPWVAVRGEIRVSLARLITVTREGKHQLIGQIQVTAIEADPAASVTMRYYLHQPAGVIAREVTDDATWWVGVLDAHYRHGGAPVHTSDADVDA